MGSGTGQLALDSAGNITVAGAVNSSSDVRANTNFVSTAAFAVLATTGAGSVLLRPNGAGSGVGQALLGSGGDLATTSLTPGGGRTLSKITVTNAAPGALASGELHLQY